MTSLLISCSFFTPLFQKVKEMVNYTLWLRSIAGHGSSISLGIQQDFEMPELPREEEEIIIGTKTESVDQVWHDPIEGRIFVECQVGLETLLTAITISPHWRHAGGSKENWENLQNCVGGTTSLKKLNWV